jgi:hypothetical protein
MWVNFDSLSIMEATELRLAKRKLVGDDFERGKAQDK